MVGTVLYSTVPKTNCTDCMILCSLGLEIKNFVRQYTTVQDYSGNVTKHSPQKWWAHASAHHIALMFNDINVVEGSSPG